MENDILNTLNSLEGAVNQLLAALAENLYLHIIRYLVLGYKLTEKIVLNLAG